MQELSTLKTATGQDVIGTEAGRLFRRWLLGNGGHDVGDCGNIFGGKGSGLRLSSVTQLMMFLFSLSPG